MSAKIEKLIAEENWSAARKAIEVRLVAEPANHWLLDRLSAVAYEQRNYTEALLFAEAAMALSPHCPLVLWDYAGALDMLDRTKEAEHVYASLLLRGFMNVAEDECGEGEAWAKGLLADCAFRFAACKQDLGEPTHAVQAYLAYLGMTTTPVPSIYTQEMAQEQLRKLSAHKDVFDWMARAAQLWHTTAPEVYLHGTVFHAAGSGSGAGEKRGGKR